MKKSTGKKFKATGFLVSGLNSGIKDKNIKDLGLIYSRTPAVVAGVFTKNQIKSPSVVFTQDAIQHSKTHRAILVNSGNANAMTGETGFKDCEKIAGKLASTLAVDRKELLLASTGVIGVPLPREKIINHLPSLKDSLSNENWEDFAQAILTTDTASKSIFLEMKTSDETLFIGGIAKGSGMIEPNMATMLGFVVTNATISKKDLHKALVKANELSFNRISVDGECSTNDMVLVMANGQNKTRLKPGTKDFELFQEGLNTACLDLAEKIVRDGEGATKLVRVKVLGAKTEKAGRDIAKTIANSLLVKTALFGEDPNWGRIAAAVGYSPQKIDPDLLEIKLNGHVLVKNGIPKKNLSREKLESLMKKDEIVIQVHLHLGDEEVEVLTCDLSYDYVRINAEYTT